MPIVQPIPLPEKKKKQTNFASLRQSFQNVAMKITKRAMQSLNFVTGVSGWRLTAEGDLEANSGTFRGKLIAGELHIPDEDTTDDSVHINTAGDFWLGATKSDFDSNNDNAIAYILKTGFAKFQNTRLGGSVKQYLMNDNGQFTFGDESDGDVVISGNTTSTEDKYYGDLTINDGVTLTPDGFRIFVAGTLTFLGTGKIAGNGNAGGNGGAGANAPNFLNGGTGGTAGTAGAGFSVKYLNGSKAGKAGQAGGGGVSTGAGGNGTNGTAGNSAANSIGVAGVAGGAGGAGGNANQGDGTPGTAGTAGGAGGFGGSNVKLIANTHLFTLLDVGTLGDGIKFDNSSGSGSGGSGGGGTGDGAGTRGAGGGGGGSGGSGSSGRIIAIYAKDIVISSGALIEAIGGAGGNGGDGGDGNADTGSGGGGGGGGAGGGGGNGGQIILVYNTLTNNGSILVTGGSGGNASTGGNGSVAGDNGSVGAAGTAGTAGTVRQFKVSQ